MKLQNKIYARNQNGKWRKKAKTPTKTDCQFNMSVTNLKHLPEKTLFELPRISGTLLYVINGTKGKKRGNEKIGLKKLSQYFLYRVRNLYGS